VTKLGIIPLIIKVYVQLQAGVLKTFFVNEMSGFKMVYDTATNSSIS